MEKFSAENFMIIAKFLANARAKASAMGSLETKVNNNLLEGSPGHTILTAVRNGCEKIGLRISVKSADYILESGTGQDTVGSIIESISQLEKTITWEMEDRLFMYIPPARAERYELAEPFGPEVAKGFPAASFDTKEAGNCFASGRFTACVFHLMRVLEIGLVAFARIFPDVPTNKENWQQIIEKIESEIRAMPNAKVKAPDWKEKQEKYSQIANNCMFFKDAWRNYTAHARGKYTEDESDAIYRNVRSFMQGLAAQGISEQTQ